MKIYEIYSEFLTKEASEALLLKKNGDIAGATKIMNLDKMKSISEKHLEDVVANRDKLFGDIAAYILRVDIIDDNSDLMMHERLKEVCASFDEVLDLAYSAEYDKIGIAAIVVSYADYLYDYNMYNHQYSLYMEALEIYREEQKNSDVKSEIADILSKISVLFMMVNDKDKAEHAARESFEIYRDLAFVNPKTYNSDYACSLNNLATIHIDDVALAEKEYLEALKIRRELVEVDYDEHISNLLNTLLSLANLYTNNDEFRKAELYYKENLDISLDLVKRRPEIAVDIAEVYVTLGILHHSQENFVEALSDFNHALDLRRAIKDSEMDANLSSISVILNNLGFLNSALGKYSKAEECYVESVEIRRTLSKKNQQSYLPEVALTLNNLGLMLDSKVEDYEAAERYYREALEIYYYLYEEISAEEFSDPLVTTMTNLSGVLKMQGRVEEADALKAKIS